MSGEIDFLSLILGAGPVVKSVMAILVLASIVSWYAIINRARITARARRESTRFEKAFWGGKDLGALYKQHEGVGSGAMAEIFIAGFREFVKLRERHRDDAESVLESVRRAMRVTQNRETDDLERFLPVLATIGSTSPYVGLFGTVWGIMTSFQALGGVRQATLSMVAPGISEALVATAMGLIAAIPAVVAYNRYSSEVSRLDGRFEDFSEEFLNILQRQLPGKN
ncbi:MAG: protein TolQ [Gammaproteobacteria bacterium]|jgi:biopolymer transport protein TolQ